MSPPLLTDLPHWVPRDVSAIDRPGVDIALVPPEWPVPPIPDVAALPVGRIDTVVAPGSSAAGIAAAIAPLGLTAPRSRAPTPSSCAPKSPPTSPAPSSMSTRYTCDSCPRCTGPAPSSCTVTSRRIFTELAPATWCCSRGASIRRTRTPCGIARHQWRQTRGAWSWCWTADDLRFPTTRLPRLRHTRHAALLHAWALHHGTGLEHADGIA